MNSVGTRALTKVLLWCLLGVNTPKHRGGTMRRIQALGTDSKGQHSPGPTHNSRACCIVDRRLTCGAWLETTTFLDVQDSAIAVRDASSHSDPSRATTHLPCPPSDSGAHWVELGGREDDQLQPLSTRTMTWIDLA